MPVTKTMVLKTARIARAVVKVLSRMGAPPVFGKPTTTGKSVASGGGTSVGTSVGVSVVVITGVSVIVATGVSVNN